MEPEESVTFDMTDGRDGRTHQAPDVCTLDKE